MAQITCSGIEDPKDPVECLAENWQGSGMCRYCWDIDLYNAALAEKETN